MREFKFRAWNEKTKKMILSSNGVVEFWDVVTDVIGKDNLIIWEIMQWTGLLDKNGVEIYEGDILKLEPADLITEVTWDDEQAMFFFPKYNIWFYRYAHKQEIIGNIYKNPELLEKTT